MTDIPAEYRIWSAQDCATYLGQSYSHFIKRTQYVEGFPKRCPIPGRPRWAARDVMAWVRGEVTEVE